MGPLSLALALALLSPAPVAKSDVAEAKRLYSIGEKAMDAKRAAEAVSLWRRAIVLLPTTTQYDALRHKLVLRLGHGMLVASAQTGKRAFAAEAVAMLERYAIRHEQLFGETPEAERERADVYELLYEAETQLDGPDGPAAEAPSAPARVDEGAPELKPRNVKVAKQRKVELASIEDPRVVARLNSRATNVETGLVMTKPDRVELHPARGLVRIDGIARPIAADLDADARRTIDLRAREAFVSVRPALRRCFEEAFARTPTDVVPTAAELVLEPDGTVSAAEVVGAPVIDDAGSKCVRERLADARTSGGSHDARTRVRVSLVFFWQEAVQIDEGSGVTGRDMAFLFRVQPRVDPEPPAMPPIEGNDFASTRRQTNAW